jgi:Rap1a immunity proteins
MRLPALILIAGLGAVSATPAFSATFAELVAWCAPEDAGGRPGLCSGYLETYLPALASPDALMNDGVRACVPETTDRAEIWAMIQDYAREHPEAANEPGVEGLGRVLKDRYPCPG